MPSRHLQHARRGICVASAGVWLAPLGVAAQPSSPRSNDPVTGLVAEGGTGGPVDAAQDQRAQPASSSSAATDLGTIIVTANKRSERLQPLPMAISALQGEQLKRETAVSFADYATRVPGLNLVSQGPGQTQIVLRGITSGANTPNATVGTYIDDTPHGSSTVYTAGSALTPDLDPDDVQRIEVLRGPQVRCTVRTRSAAC